MPTRASKRVHQWLVIVALAAGLIGMHHLIGGPGHHHGGHHHHTPASTETSTAALTDTVSSDGSVSWSGMVNTAHQVAVAAVGSVEPGGCCSEMAAMMGHLCLAILTAAALVLGALIVFGVAAGTRSVPLPVAHALGGLQPRAPPPVGVRLSLLGVWRR